MVEEDDDDDDDDDDDEDEDEDEDYREAYISSHTRAFPACSVRTSPIYRTPINLLHAFPAREEERLTIISSFFATLIPFLFVTCKYFNPLSTSCCTTKLAFMRNLAPSLMVKGFDFSASTEPGAVRSMVMSGRPSTSRARDLMTQRRLSLGSTGMGGEEEMPSEAFQRLRDSSFWSGRELDVRSTALVQEKTTERRSKWVWDIAKVRRDACKRREVEYVCEWFPISRPQRGLRHHSSTIGISSKV